MFGGGGGLNPRKMQKMMEQMGIELEEFDAERVVITLSDGEELVFDDPDVTKMEARGQSTFQVVGDPESRPAGASGEPEVESDEGDDVGDIPDSDVELVVQRTGVDEATARETLEAENGDLAAAISKLE